MKYSFTTYLITTLSGITAFILTYFTELAICNSDQYMALIGVILTDGIFGIISGVKNEGFKTYKALKILKTLVVWVILLTLILSIEKAFPEISWLSETILIPFIIFELISTLKNASMAGFIKKEDVNLFFDKIDQHKGKRKK
jgi:phage-related holin